MKAQLRQHYLSMRLALSDAYILQATRAIHDAVRQHRYYQQAKHIGLYHPIKKEVNLLSLLTDNKLFYLPKVVGDDLVYLSFSSTTNLVLSSLQIQEPEQDQNQSANLDLIIIPALSVDAFKHRLGYGKGYFDRFMHKHRHIKVIAVVYREQQSKQPLPISEYDIQVDDIITN